MRILRQAALTTATLLGAVTSAHAVKPLTAEQLSHNVVKVAAVQIDGNWIWTAPLPQENTPADQVIPYIERAGREGVDLILFPELYLGMFRVPHPETDKIAAAAKANNVNVVIGCFEVVDDEGNYGNSSLIFNREGEIVGRFFKAFQAVGGPPHLWPPIANDPEWMMFPGEDFPVFDLDFGRIGILTCYDGYFPEPFRLLSLRGAEVILWPNARGGAVEDYIVRTNIAQNYVHMVTSNKAMGAGTMIGAWPFGIQANCEEPGECYVVADLNMEMLRQGRTHSREFHQLRPEIFKDLGTQHKPWAAYGFDESTIEVPEPDVARREQILEGIGVPVKKKSAE